MAVSLDAAFVHQLGEDQQIRLDAGEGREGGRQLEIAAEPLRRPGVRVDAVRHVQDSEPHRRPLPGLLDGSAKGGQRLHRLQQRQAHGDAHAFEDGSAGYRPGLSRHVALLVTGSSDTGTGNS